MKGLSLLGLIGLAVMVSGCASGKSPQDQQSPLSVEQLMLQSAQSVEKTLNELVVIEKGPQEPFSEKSLIDSTVARPIKPGEPLAKGLLAGEASVGGANKNKTGKNKTVIGEKMGKMEGGFRLWLSASAERPAVNPEQIWAATVKIHWSGDAPGFIRAAASTLNYDVKVMGDSPVWPEILVDSTNSKFQDVWSDFVAQVSSVAHFKVSDADRTIFITYENENEK